MQTRGNTGDLPLGAVTFNIMSETPGRKVRDTFIFFPTATSKYLGSLEGGSQPHSALPAGFLQPGFLNTRQQGQQRLVSDLHLCHHRVHTRASPLRPALQGRLPSSSAAPTPRPGASPHTAAPPAGTATRAIPPRPGDPPGRAAARCPSPPAGRSCRRCTAAPRRRRRPAPSPRPRAARPRPRPRPPPPPWLLGRRRAPPHGRGGASPQGPRPPPGGHAVR